VTAKGPVVALIAAVADNGVIGKDGGLPWRIPADLKWFRAHTMGHHVVMGRKTWASIVAGSGRPLPGRTNVVVTRDAALSVPDGVVVVDALGAAIELAAAAGDDEVFVIGGGELYRAAMPRADRIYLTRIHAHVDGDTVFPPIDESAWVEVARESHGAKADGSGEPLPFSFCVLERAARADPSASGT
jgi:dihydrofolate reductase